METAVGLLGIFVIPAAVLAVVFLAFVQPIWALVDCSSTERLSKEGRTIWIVMMFLTFGMGFYVYGLFGTRGALRRMTWISMFVLFLGIPTLALVPRLAVATGTAGQEYAACIQEELELQSKIEIYRFENNRIPETLGEVANHFDTSLPEVCPTHKTPYEIDPQTGAITHAK